MPPEHEPSSLHSPPGRNAGPEVVSPDRSWPAFLKVARPTTDYAQAGVVLCLDPGETTGWALFDDGLLIECGQENTGRHPAYMAEFIYTFQPEPNTLVYEEYRIRGNKVREHIGSEVVTIQHIGVIRAVADDLGVELVKQSAGMAKGFATDTKLRRWGLYQVNQRHANDAIRHGVYYHLFYFGRKDPRHASQGEG